MTDTTVDLVVRFRDGRIGRQRNVPDLAVSVPFYDDGDPDLPITVNWQLTDYRNADDTLITQVPEPDWDDVCDQIDRYARRYLASRDIDVDLITDGQGHYRGSITVGMFREVARWSAPGALHHRGRHERRCCRTEFPKKRLQARTRRRPCHDGPGVTTGRDRTLLTGELPLVRCPRARIVDRGTWAGALNG